MIQLTPMQHRYHIRHLLILLSSTIPLFAAEPSPLAKLEQAKIPKDDRPSKMPPELVAVPLSIAPAKRDDLLFNPRVIGAIAFSPVDRLLAAAVIESKGAGNKEQSYLCIWEFPSLKQVLKKPLGDSKGRPAGTLGFDNLRFAADGKRLIGWTGIPGEPVLTWDLSGEQQDLIPAHRGEKADRELAPHKNIWGIPQLSPNGDLLVVVGSFGKFDSKAMTNGDRDVAVWSVEHPLGKPLHSNAEVLPKGKAIWHSALSWDGRWLAVSNRFVTLDPAEGVGQNDETEHSVRMLDLSGKVPKIVSEVPARSIETMCFSPNGKILSAILRRPAGSRTQKSIHWQIDSDGKLGRPIEADLPFYARKQSYSADGKRFMFVGGKKIAWMTTVETGMPDLKMAQLIDLEEYQQDAADIFGIQCYSLANDGKHVAVGLLNGSIWILRMK